MNNVTFCYKFLELIIGSNIELKKIKNKYEQCNILLRISNYLCSISIVYGVWGHTSQIK